MLKQQMFTRFDCFIDNPEAEEPEFEVVSAQVTESISEPYEVVVQLSSPLVNLTPKSFIKHPARLILNLGEAQRYFHGFIGQFTQRHMITTNEGETRCLYEAKLYPHLWFLKANKNYRIFQNKTTLAIVKELLQENRVQHISPPSIVRQRSVMLEVDPLREYCVQYGESDFDFISRLLEDRGFYYYFEHEAHRHNLKLAFSRHDHHLCREVESVEIRDVDFEGNELNAILTHEVTSSLQPQHQVLMDYDYAQASLEMVSHSKSVGKEGVVYTYPGGFNQLRDAHTKTKLRVEHDVSEAFVLNGTSTAPFFSPGFKFTLLGHPNGFFDEKMFTLETVTHKITDPRYVSDEDSSLYTNTFSAFLSNVSYRPLLKTPKPKIHGTQTAIVVAPHGEEVWTDEQGRVQVQFHWNHRGYKRPVVIHNHSNESDHEHHHGAYNHSRNHRHYSRHHHHGYEHPQESKYSDRDEHRERGERRQHHYRESDNSSDYNNRGEG